MRKWIGYYDDVISAKHIQEIFDYPWHWTPSTYSSHKGQNDNSEERVRMDEVWAREENRPYPSLKESVLKSMRFYGKEHENFSCIHHTDFRINKYGVDGFMSSHIDNIHHSHGQKYGYPQVSVLLFLNDDYEGGEIIVADNEYHPTVGSALIFPSNFMFPHEVKPVTKGERWSVISWLM
jgi:hypothetical protein|tara:strand:+ start:63 stop:599 length:537 start_codon:yes stop_codon:yes gene_type:complete